MRISGGAARGIPLITPKGLATRPATDGLRQAVFSSLGARVLDARFLDLFAGSGAYGLEALSRGAASGSFVEYHGRTADCVRQNITAVCRSLGRPEAGLTVVRGDALLVPWSQPEPPDLVFIDPPYERIPAVAPVLFERLANLLRPQPEALVIFEAPGDVPLEPAGWSCLKRIGKGARQPTISVFSLDAAQAR